MMYEQLPGGEAEASREPTATSVPPPPPAYEVATVHHQAATAAPIRGRFHVKRACFCLTTKSAVWLMAALDTVQAVWAVLTAGLLVFARTHEHAIDKAFVSTFSHLSANATQAHFMDFHANMTAAETSVAVANLNDKISFFAARGVPALLFFAVVMFAFGAVGMKAQAGDLYSAKLYSCWKFANAFVTIFSCSIFHFFLALYCAVVARSHFVSLVENQVQSTILPTVSVTVTQLATAAPAPLAAPPATASQQQAAKTTTIN